MLTESIYPEVSVSASAYIYTLLVEVSSTLVGVDLVWAMVLVDVSVYTLVEVMFTVSTSPASVITPIVINLLSVEVLTITSMYPGFIFISSISASMYTSGGAFTHSAV